MGHYVTQYWPPATSEPDGESYQAYVPHLIEGWQPELSHRAQYRLEAAEKDLVDAVENAASVSSCRWATDCLMLQSESLSSSAIEGVYSSLEGLVARPEKQDMFDRTALGNWEMLDAAADMAHDYQPFRVADIKELHEILMIKSDNPQIAGQLRQGPGWVGQQQHHSQGPLRARYVPPPAYLIDDLLDDLVAMINYSGLQPLCKASLVHTQFETIHPFSDGNGRVGRALILVSLGRSGVTKGATLPISHALLQNRQGYYNSLLRYQRFTGAEDALERSYALEGIVLLMADSVHLAAAQMREAASAIEATMRDWQNKLADSHQQPASRQVLEELLRIPVFTIDVLQDQTGLPKQTVDCCVAELQECGIVTTNEQSPNTIYTADDILQIVDNILQVRSRSSSCAK